MTDNAPDDASLDATDPAAYRFWTEERVRFADLDMQGHANNNAIGVYFETGRVAIMQALGRFGAATRWTVVVARLVTDFRAQLNFPAEIRVGVRIRRIGNTSVTMGLAVFDGDRCAATQEAVMVLVDKASGKPTPVPDDLRAGLAAYA